MANVEKRENSYTDPVTGKFVEGNPGGGRPEGSKNDPVKKAIKQYIAEYQERLAEALPLIDPVLIKKAKEGDVQAIKELHDRVMGKAPQTLKGDKENPIFQPVLVKFIDENDKDSKGV